MSAAGEAMTAALLAAVDHHEIPPCGHSSDAWMAEDRDQRAGAAHACTGCPLFDVCAAYAREVKPVFGVWAGRDWTKTPRRPK